MEIGIKTWYFHIVFIIGFVLLMVSCRLQLFEQKQLIHEKIELGQKLFFEKGMSYDGRLSCASCHDPLKAFTDGYKTSVNGMGDVLHLNSPSLLNLHYYKYFSQVDSNVNSLYIQMDRPLFGRHPVEIGFDRDSTRILNLLREMYKQEISKTYKNFGTHELKDCMIWYIKSLENRNSKWDSIQAGSLSATSESAVMDGFNVFQKYQCSQCHGGLDFNKPEYGIPYFHLDTTGKLLRISGLRNLSYSSPYLHDGSAQSLQDVFDSHIVHKWVHEDFKLISTEEKRQLKKFLFSMSGRLDQK